MMIRVIQVVAKDLFGEAFSFSWSRFVREASSEGSRSFVTTSDYLLIVDSRFGRFKRFWLSLIKNSNYSLVCLNRFENDLTK